MRPSTSATRCHCCSHLPAFRSLSDLLNYNRIFHACSVPTSAQPLMADSAAARRSCRSSWAATPPTSSPNRRGCMPGRPCQRCCQCRAWARSSLTSVSLGSGIAA
eukprot:907774-Pyramimonas_sp.AAC.1